jgi:hypothetical protein
MRCPACGVETGGPGPSCAVCGTYLAMPPPLPAKPVTGARRSQRNDDYQAAEDKRQRAKDKRAAVKYGSWLLAAIAAVVAGVLTHPGSQSSSSLRQLTACSPGQAGNLTLLIELTS